MRFRLAPIFAIALLVRLPLAGAQPQTPDTAPAHVAYVDGMVTLERDGRPESAPLNMPLLSGDRLKTMDGRAEVLFGDGSALHVDAQTTIDLQADDLLRLIDGRVRLSVAGLAGAPRSAPVLYRVDSPAGSVRLTQAGDYRIAILRRGDEVQVELAVLRGAGEVFTDAGATTVRAGERAYASAGLAPSYAYTYNSANWDAFDRWSESRRDARMGVSSQYLPAEVRPYASTFDEDGDWRYEQAYGYVWYPRVAVSWRPYYYGRWASYPRYGWTWIGADRFAWATHHYGRWGVNAGAWFWIPANRWAPAYVSWAYSPGYVSWCPLGFDNRPVIGVNIFNVLPGYYSSSRAWTAMGYAQFGRDYVHRRAVDWDRVDRGRRPSFQVTQTAPAVRDVAVPRGAPIRSAGVSPGAGPSTGAEITPGRAPRYINRGDRIVRSRTEPPSALSQPSLDDSVAVPRFPTAPGRSSSSIDPSTAPGRSSNSVEFSTAPRRSSSIAERTIPSGPARRIETPGPANPSESAARPRDTRDGGIAYSPRSPYERGSAVPRGDHPIYRAPVYQAPPASDRPSPPAYRPPAPSAPESAPRGEARPRNPGGGARTAPSGPPSAPGLPSGARSRGRGGV